MEVIIEYQWSLFIALEVASFLFLVLFLAVRYAIAKNRLSSLFLGFFMLAIILEAILAWLIYRATGEIDIFQLVIALFVVYAFTFGIADFRRLDRFIKKHVGKWRGTDLLTEDDKRKMAAARDPQAVARKYRRSWYIHAALFIAVHSIFWSLYGSHEQPPLYYLTDLSWFGEKDFGNAPFTSDTVNAVSKLWMLIFAVDTLISLSYTVFPDKKKEGS